MNTADILTLPARVKDIFIQIQRWKDGLITQPEASRVLRLSERHFRRLVRKFESEGLKGLLATREGKKPSNKIDDAIRLESLRLIRKHFYDYGPTLASEKLNEYFDITVSKETVRRWMIDANLWRTKQRSLPKIHPQRARRPFLGELVQVDGSHHHWFEDRGPKACLLVFIDDATGKLLNLKFAPGETTLDYLTMLKEYVLEYGAPRAMYFDKHNVFHINQKTTQKRDGCTQFCRALNELQIEPIYAHSPQAKGRVERANSTLQDRLLKELRFFNINNIEDANKHLKQFIIQYNEKFSVSPEEPIDLHRHLSASEAMMLDNLCSIQTIKTISKDLLVKHKKAILKIIRDKNTPKKLIHQKVTLCEDYSGVRLYLNQHLLRYETISKPSKLVPTLNRKNMEQYLDYKLDLKKYWSRISQ